jgi:hypothetical protein
MRAYTILAALILASAVPAAAWAAATPGTSPAPESKLTFNGAHLGMTLEQWKSLPISGGNSSHVELVCTDDLGRNPKSGQASGAGAVVCSRVVRYRGTALMQSIPFLSSYRARSPKYYFADGRLSKIDFLVSVDAFNTLDAMFTKKLDVQPATDRIVDKYSDGVKFDRVERIWALPDIKVKIVDPSDIPSQIQVQYSRVEPG